MWKPLEQYLIGAKRNFELFVHDVANDNLVNHRSNPCSCLQLSLGSAENNTLFSAEPSDSRKYVCVRRLFKPQSQPESRRVLIIIKLEIVITRAAPAFHKLFMVMGCVFHINKVHKTVEKLTFQAFY